MKLIKPMKAKSGNVEELWADTNWAVEEKFDGARYMMYVTVEGNRFLSRRQGKNTNGMPVEKSDRIPHISKAKVAAEWLDTVVDGEVIAPNQDFGSVISIIGSLADRAVAHQEKHGWAKYVMFDLVRYKGQDVTHEPFWKRRKMLKEFAKNFHCKNAVVAKCIRGGDKRKVYERVVKRGGEGVMLKDLHAPYFPGERTTAWLKVKKQFTVDAVIIGFEDGRGKYNTDEVGAIIFGGYKNGKLVRWGTCGGLTKELIGQMTADKDSFIGRVIEVECNLIHTSGKLRHPRFFRLRDDKDATECAWGC